VSDGPGDLIPPNPLEPVFGEEPLAGAMEELTQIAQLIRERNALDARIAEIIGRPALPGHLGEWIASRVFDLELSASATARDVDGHFRSGPLAGQSVNVKLYGKRENVLDLEPETGVQWYLVLAGPRGYAVSSRGSTRPLTIASVHIFETATLLAALTGRVKIGIASSVRQPLWDSAEIYPRATSTDLRLSHEQQSMLALFAAPQASL
jgi:hypothetical protein